VGSDVVVLMREERGEPCHSSEHVLCVQMTALGILDHCAKGSNMVYQHLVPLRLTIQCDLCMDLFSGSREPGASHRSFDVGS
jgi:hypothetical protein